jgi:hypothetical protein
MIKTKKTLSLLKFTYCISEVLIIIDADNKKMETRMSKRHILKEVSAKSMCGMEIVVEQIYENIYEKNFVQAEQEQNWLPLSKIVISDKVINLDQDNTFAHPRTGKVFKVLNS